MTTERKIYALGSLFLIVIIGGFGIYEWITKEVIHAETLFVIFVGIGFLFQSLTWGNIDGKHEGEKDELEKHITLVSSKISYYVLLLLMVLVLFVSERALIDIKNIPLVIVIGLAWVTLPITGVMSTYYVYVIQPV